MDRRNGGFDQRGDLACAAEMMNDLQGFGVHVPLHAIIGSEAQEESSDNRDCDIRIQARKWRVAENKEIKTTQPEAVDILTRLDRLGLKQRGLAGALEIEENKVSKVRAGERRFTATEVLIAREWLETQTRELQAFGQGKGRKQPEQPVVDPQQDYEAIEVLPTFGGAGGGGTGDADRERALVPRALIRDVLRGKPADFLVINVRGDSMEPDFRHGDQLLIDKRDNSPAQPGPFALWDGEWGEYVVKNVERSQAGEVRVFSSNSKYTADVAESEQTRIIGRPVWFGRRL